jgi:hypothetical protein
LLAYFPFVSSCVSALSLLGGGLVNTFPWQPTNMHPTIEEFLYASLSV